jgi:hypothetical protein
MILIPSAGVHAGERLLLISHIFVKSTGLAQENRQARQCVLFSERLLSFAPAVPRIRLTFQTLVFGFSAICDVRRRAAECFPGDDLKRGSSKPIVRSAKRGAV